MDTETGTGLVHLSPANGEEDFQVATRRGVPVFAPIDDRVRFTEEAGRFAGLFVRDADSVVSKLLAESGNLVNEGRLEHEYPTCWRSGHRLVWVARREYFYWIDRVKDMLVEAAEKVEYYFDAPQEQVHRVPQAVAPVVHLQGEGLGDAPPDLGVRGLQGEGARLLAPRA